jgi:hypothetical protein
VAACGGDRENKAQQAGPVLSLMEGMRADQKYPWYVRPAFAALGFGLVSMALAPLLKGHRFYTNYFGDLVFAPVALLIGFFVLYLAIFRWDRVARRGRQETVEIRGR